MFEYNSHWTEKIKEIIESVNNAPSLQPYNRKPKRTFDLEEKLAKWLIEIDEPTIVAHMCNRTGENIVIVTKSNEGDYSLHLFTLDGNDKGDFWVYETSEDFRYLSGEEILQALFQDTDWLELKMKNI